MNGEPLPVELLVTADERRPMGKDRLEFENERALVGARMANLRLGSNQHNEGRSMETPSKPAVSITRAAELAEEIDELLRELRNAEPGVDRIKSKRPR